MTDEVRIHRPILPENPDAISLRLQIVLPLLLVVPIAPFPTGAYPMPEVCRRLSEATGTKHVVDGALRDYPVFVAAKSGEPARVKRLVAAALHAEWREEDGKLRLVAVKPVDEPDRPEFERLYRQACGENEVHLALPIGDLYRMPIGQIYRYGAQPTDTVRKLAAAGKGVVVRRLAAGVFEFGNNHQMALTGLPDAVQSAIGKDLAKEVLDAQARAEIKKRVSDPQAARLDFGDLDKTDPIAVMAEPILKGVSQAIQPDLAVALGDFSLFPAMMAGEGNGQVKAILEGYSQLLDWAVVDGAVVGRLTMTERLYSTQTKRIVLRDLLKSVGAEGVASIDAIGQYVANQRPGASDGWCDAGLLVIGGVVLDQQYIGHYPFNARLYTKLSPRDWGVIRTGEAFPASAFSPATQRALTTLLLQSREVLSGQHQDPGFWPTVRPDRLVVKAELVEEPVLIGWTSLMAEVYEVKNSALQYDMRKKKLGREPLYRPATRRTLKLTVGRMDNQYATIETGFSEVMPTPNEKAVVWEKLPKEMAKQFSDALDEMRRLQQNDQGGNPPPPSVP